MRQHLASPATVSYDVAVGGSRVWRLAATSRLGQGCVRIREDDAGHELAGRLSVPHINRDLMFSGLAQPGRAARAATGHAPLSNRPSCRALCRIWLRRIIRRRHSRRRPAGGAQGRRPRRPTQHPSAPRRPDHSAAVEGRHLEVSTPRVPGAPAMKFTTEFLGFTDIDQIAGTQVMTSNDEAHVTVGYIADGTTVTAAVIRLLGLRDRRRLGGGRHRRRRVEARHAAVSGIGHIADRRRWSPPQCDRGAARPSPPTVVFNTAWSALLPNRRRHPEHVGLLRVLRARDGSCADGHRVLDGCRRERRAFRDHWCSVTGDRPNDLANTVDAFCRTMTSIKSHRPLNRGDRGAA